MSNYLRNPNFLKQAPAILITLGALAMSGCAVDTRGEGYLKCTGSEPVTTQPGYTLNGILLENTDGVNIKNVNDVAIELDRMPQFRGSGNLPDFTVPHYDIGERKPGVMAGETIDVPTECSLA